MLLTAKTRRISLRAILFLWRNLVASLRLFVFTGFLLGCNKSPDTLFTYVPSDDSGIHFTNIITPSKELNAFTFTNFYNGGGVGVGDFNRDGRPDLFFTGNQESCRLYVNQTPAGTSDLKFEDITETAGVRTDRWCTGVSVADVNADGWDDIYVCVAAHPALKDTRNLLFINQKTTIPTFREEAAVYGLDYSGFTTQAAFFDYDLDGDLDCFLLNTAPDLQNPNYLRPTINDGSYPSTDKLYRNMTVERGRGEKGLEAKNTLPLSSPSSLFLDISREAGIRFEGLGLGLVVSDVNADGYPDLYCSNDFVSSDILYLNRGNDKSGGPLFRNVTREAMGHTSLYGMGVDAADLNNDGRIDLMQLDMLPKENARQKQMLSAQDFDKKELSQTPQYGYQLQYMRNTLQLNSGENGSTPIFSEIGLMAGVAQTDWSWSTLLTDLDGDGQKDIFVTNGYRKNVTDKDFISFNEEFGLFGTDAVREQRRERMLDKVPEIKLRNYAFRNGTRSGADSPAFEDVSEKWGLNELSYANGAAYADLDKDGDLDLIVNNIDQEASLFRNNSREQVQNNYLSINFEGPKFNRVGIGAMVRVWTGGRLQVYEHFPVRGYLSTVSTGLMIGLAKTDVIDSIQVVWPGRLSETRYRLKVNQRLTFKVSGAKPLPVHHEKPAEKLFKPLPALAGYQHQESDFVDFKTTPALHKMLSRSGLALAVGDLNSDGFEDIAVGASYRGSGGALFFGKPNGQFLRREWMPANQMEAGAILLFDADKDADNDLLVVGGGNERPFHVAEAYEPVLFRNDGKGSFISAPFVPGLRVSSQAVKALDYDSDGDEDVLITGRQIPGKYPAPASSYLLRNDNGRFVDVTAQVAPALTTLGLVCDALAADIDNDRDNDLILVGEWMPPTILQNNNGHFSSSPVQSFKLYPGWWNCVTAADFDHDGDSDLLLGNEGINTIYRASVQEPIVIVGKDFNEDGQFDPIMGYFINGIQYPSLPRETLIQQIIQFRRKYLRYADYAEATFDDLFLEKERKSAYQKEATELRSCYAENRGGGKFILRPLPGLAQRSPIFSFIVADFDHDGHSDALATGNFFPNEANMGRQDASQGLLLKGDGKGNFTALGPDKTGFSVPGDARRSYQLRNPARIITAINGGPLMMHSWKSGN